MNTSLLIFEALGHETRFKVFDFIYRCGKVGGRPKDMIDEFGFDSGTLDFHLKKLLAAQLICLKSGSRRGIYCVCDNTPQWLLQAFASSNVSHALLLSEFPSAAMSKTGMLN